MFVSKEKFWVFCVFDSNMTYFYVLCFLILLELINYFFNFIC